MEKNRVTPMVVIGKIFIWIFVIFIAVYALFPIIWLAISSLKTNAELIKNPFSLPATPQFGNYANAFNVSGIGRMMLNSLIISFIATISNVIIAAMAAYPISRFKFIGGKLFQMLFAAGMVIPLNALMLPYFKTVTSLGLYNTFIGLVIVYVAIGIPISSFIMVGFMRSIPRDLEEAAWIDGAGFIRRFTRIIFPLSRTGLITAGTFHFTTCWNEFVYANLLTESPNIRTLQLGIRYFTNQFSTDFVSMYAAIIISIIPSIIVYILFQNQIIAGLTSGSVKG